MLRCAVPILPSFRAGLPERSCTTMRWIVLRRTKKYLAMVKTSLPTVSVTNGLAVVGKERASWDAEVRSAEEGGGMQQSL